MAGANTPTVFVVGLVLIALTALWVARGKPSVVKFVLTTVALIVYTVLAFVDGLVR